MNKKLIFLPLGVFCCSILTNCGGKTLTIWVDSKIVEVTKQEVNKFKEANPEFNYNVRIDTVSEKDAASNMITDVESGADLFVYAQDQFTRLISAGALTAVPTESESESETTGMEKEMIDNHITGAIKAVTHQGENDTRPHVYSYPVSSDNGYFLFYDKSYFSEDDVKTVEDIVSICEQKKKFFGVSVTGGWWYSAGFFMSRKIVGGVPSDTPMCHSNWTTSSSGSFIAKDDDFAKNGVFACKGMAKIFASEYFLDSHNADDFNNGCIALIDGNWDYGTAKGILGDNLGMTKLPTFTVTDDDEPGTSSTYQMGSFSGYKFMGVKPHNDAKKSYWCAKLAKYLTDKDAQLDRFNAVGWGPSHNEALKDEKVKEAPGLKALADQNQYAVPERSYPGDWYNFGEDRVSGQIKNNKRYKRKDITTDLCKELLDGYEKQIETLVEEE